jgi:Aspartyl/Asparaginyl beta-hydroxylase
MVHVEKIDLSFDIRDLISGLETVLQICDYHPQHSQIGITQSIGSDASETWHDAAGSLFYKWGNDAFDENGKLKQLEHPRLESDFKYFVKEFSGTIFEDVYHQLCYRYKIGRIRLMKSRPKTCLSWHTDTEKRLHIPIVTNPGARLVIEDYANHLPADGSAYLADTTKYHTAFNSGMENRIHLVACVLD